MTNPHLEFKLLADCTEHLPKLAQLHYQELARHWISNITPEKIEERFSQHVNRDSLPLTLVALENNNPIGMASLRITDGIRPELSPWLGGLVVDPLYRHKQLGQRLIDQIKRKAQHLGFEKLYLLAFDPTLPQWYKKLGWEFIGYDELLGHRVTVMNINLIALGGN